MKQMKSYRLTDAALQKLQKMQEKHGRNATLTLENIIDLAYNISYFGDKDNASRELRHLYNVYLEGRWDDEDY